MAPIWNRSTVAVQQSVKLFDVGSNPTGSAKCTIVRHRWMCVVIETKTYLFHRRLPYQVFNLI